MDLSHSTLNSMCLLYVLCTFIKAHYYKMLLIKKRLMQLYASAVII